MQAEADSDEVYAQIMLQPEADVSIFSTPLPICKGGYILLLQCMLYCYCSISAFLL